MDRTVWCVVFFEQDSGQGSQYYTDFPKYNQNHDNEEDAKAEQLRVMAELKSRHDGLRWLGFRIKRVETWTGFQSTVGPRSEAHNEPDEVN